MIIATTENILIDSLSIERERIVVWKGKDGLFNVFHHTPTVRQTTILAFGSIQLLLAFLPVNESWLLMGVKDTEIEQAIQDYLS